MPVSQEELTTCGVSLIDPVLAVVNDSYTASRYCLAAASVCGNFNVIFL